MGLYPIDCPKCKKPHIWFSGNSDQRCSECSKPREWFLQMHTDEGFDPIALEVNEKQHDEDDVRVIEYSAYEALNKKYVDLLDLYNQATTVIRGDS